MLNPNIKGHATPESLREYALFRKKQEMEDIKTVRKEKDEGKIECDNDSENYREPLCVDTEQVITVLLSTGGGDGDGFKFYADKKREIYKAVYFWEDWGCYEEIKLSDKEKDLVADYYNISETI